MKLMGILVLYLLVSMTFAGPIAFQTCLQGLTLFGGGCSAALATCSASIAIPHVYLTCVTTAMGFGGGIFLAGCVAALFAPTP